jgi:predicted TIM-barrel fold metal-dependent hydrolase
VVGGGPGPRSWVFSACFTEQSGFEAGTSHVLFGTNSPYDHGVCAAFTAALDVDDSLTAEDQTAISHGNALTLFPRLVHLI